MYRKKRAQVAIEYMAVVFISLILISGFTYYFFSQKDSYEDEAMESRVDHIGNKISQYAEEAHYSTGPYRKVFKTRMPEPVDSLRVQDKNQIVFETSDGRNFVYMTRIPVYGYIENGSIQSGKIVVENVNNKAVICSDTPCSCAASEIHCDDLADNDCDGYVDGADTDCCPDADSDNYTDIDHTGTGPHYCQLPDTFAQDCNGSDPNVNPDRPEQCDPIDHNCDGSETNGVCGFNCYVEANFGDDGMGTCQAMYNPLFSLDSNNNSHVKVPGGANYGHDLCCENQISFGVQLNWYTSATCNAGDTRVLGFDEGVPAGGHVENGSLSNYNYSLCAEVTGSAFNLNCTLNPIGVPCTNTEIATLQNENNSHIGAPGIHIRSLCCRFE